MTVRWTIGPDPVIIANGKLGNYAELTRGEETTFEFYFDDLPDSVTQGTGGTYGGASGFTYGGSTGATYGGGAGSATYDGKRAYTELRKYGEYTNGLKTEIDINGDPTYRERTPSRDPVTTHVRKFNPDLGVESHPALWGLITGYDDPTRLVNANARLDVDVFVLGDTDDYETLSDVETALKV